MMKIKIPLSSATGTSQKTRASIKKLFPMGSVMSRGSSNPITLHSVDDDLFPRMWSFLAEVMIAEGELARSTKEAIAELVSKKNACPLCDAVHQLMGSAARNAESKRGCRREIDDERHAKALGLADKLVDTTLNDRQDELDLSLQQSARQDDVLTDIGRAEVALVVLLYFHLNRVISAILGEQMSPVLFQAKRPGRGPSIKHDSLKVKDLLKQVVNPLLKAGMSATHKPGIARPLFSSEDPNRLAELPDHLQRAALAGRDRANALYRLVMWTRNYKETMENEGILSMDVLQVLESPMNAPPSHLTPDKLAQWASSGVRRAVQHLSDETSQATATILLLVQFSPHSVFHHYQWKHLAKTLGGDQAKAMLIWWSLTCSLQQAQGLRNAVQKAGW
ncbi:expressed unknown protein [Seminavis robusta]|uniref:Uncharacterized protein n=1 Tax=Seminavis robusta TaxID=568900 RepID=A0A9N8EBL5_9STRA|nr:expressed unknown protein [Seminavis robusta]|eukprot:Sro931_g221450.1 n/a (392) ;mRNA; f:19469-20644